MKRPQAGHLELEARGAQAGRGRQPGCFSTVEQQHDVVNIPCVPVAHLKSYPALVQGKRSSDLLQELLLTRVVPRNAPRNRPVHMCITVLQSRNVHACQYRLCTTLHFVNVSEGILAFSCHPQHPRMHPPLCSLKRCEPESSLLYMFTSVLGR